VKALTIETKPKVEDSKKIEESKKVEPKIVSEVKKEE
jgi:hypothetical protein